MKKCLMAIILALTVVCLGGPLHATDITVGNADWYEFGFLALGVDAISGSGGQPSSGGNSEYAPDPPWTFTSALPVKLTVTDAFLEGDAFNIYDSGALVGSTSSVANTGTDSGTSDPVVALTIPELSHGVFSLAAGSHSLTIRPYQFVMAGAAYFRTDAVPLPPTVLLLGSGLLGLAGWRRFRKG
jgi:hypothetical protein